MLTVTAPAMAFSLYDTAPNVGLPESQVAKYYLSTTVGYDTNPQGTYNKKNRKEGEYITLAAHTDYADVESVDQLSYRLTLGATRYFGGTPSREKYYSDCGITATLVHSFSTQSRYTSSLNLSYKPEPSYADGMSTSSYTGDTLSWNWSNTYFQAIDTRWSWNAGLTYSGTHYDSSSYNYDDRQYLTPSVGLRYRESDITTYTLNISEREEWRKTGSDARSYFINGGIEQSLDPVSSFSASAGAQLKYMEHDHTLTPTLNLGYRRKVTDGLSINLFVVHSNENADNYNSRWQSSYRSTPTWRGGIRTEYRLSPDVRFGLTLQYRYAQYEKAPYASMRDYSTQSFNPNFWMSYQFTERLETRVGCEYTMYKTDNQRYTSNEYTRWRIYSQLTYQF